MWLQKSCLWALLLTTALATKLALSTSGPYTTLMIKTKKTETEKQLIKFRNQLHNLLIRNPEIRISGDSDGDPIAWIRTGDAFIYLPTSGKQELIQH
jgi:hypothetical protein